MKTLKTNNLSQSLLIIIFEIKINDKAIREKYRNKHVDESDFFNRSFGKLWSRFFEISPLSPKKKKKAKISNYSNTYLKLEWKQLQISHLH